MKAGQGEETLSSHLQVNNTEHFYSRESQNQVGVETGGAHRQHHLLVLEPEAPTAQRGEVCGLRLHSQTRVEVGATRPPSLSQPVWSARGRERESNEQLICKKASPEVRLPLR